MDRALTGHNVPERFLSETYLTGAFPLIASRADPRVSYTIYVPPDHYHPRPDSTHKKLPLLVDIHGTDRTISSIFREDEHREFARNTPCAILAPVFPAGLDDPNDVDSYKLLRSKSLRSDQVLLSILDEVAYRWPGVETSKIFMAGFSGGGQFAHRFLYLYPGRIAGINIGAPGQVTYLNEDEAWPRGIANVQDLFDRTVRRDLIREVPIQLIIGGEDTEAPNQEFWGWVQEKMGGSAPRNESRMELLQKLRDSWADDGIQTEIKVVPGVGHNGSASAILQAVYEHVGGLIRSPNSV
jgi:poly(3-hydroxybutyrate) depolymerase